MVVFGTLYWCWEGVSPQRRSGRPGARDCWLCVAGLLAIFATGYVGYFVADAIWPEFYYKPVAAGKNAWLFAQLICVAAYFIGAILVWRTLRALLRSAV